MANMETINRETDISAEMCNMKTFNGQVNDWWKMNVSYCFCLFHETRFSRSATPDTATTPNASDLLEIPPSPQNSTYGRCDVASPLGQDLEP